MVAGFKAVEGAGDFDFRGQGVEAAFLPRKLVASLARLDFRAAERTIFSCHNFLRTSKSDGKNVVLRHLRRFSGFYSNVKQAQNVLADNHKHQVANPDDVPAEQDAQNAGNDFTLADSGDCAANTRSRRNYRQNHADNVA